MRWLGPLREPFERFLSGGPAPSDPLYLSNRTPRQKIVFALKLAAPFAAVAAIAAIVFQGALFHHDHAPRVLTRAEIVERMIPDVDKIKLASNKDVEVPTVGFDRSGPLALVGSIRNNSSRAFATVEVLVELVDENGSKLGGATAEVRNLEPHADSSFRVPIQESAATIAVVRSIRAQ